MLKVFPVGLTVGIKNPYLKLSGSGTFAMRNDNPENIVFKEEAGVENQKLKELGNAFFKLGKFSQALKSYK